MKETYKPSTLAEERKSSALKMFYVSFVLFVGLSCLWILFFSGGQVEDPSKVAEREGKEVLKLWAGTAGDKRAVTVMDKVNNNLHDNFFRRHPGLIPGHTTRLQIPDAARSGQVLMALAGGSAPDVITYPILQSQTLMDQGFLEPLERFIEVEKKNDPQFESRIHIPEKLRPVITRYCEDTGREERYGLIRAYGIKALLIRKDLFLEAGLDPRDPPETWEELFTYAVRLTRPEKSIEGSKGHRGQIGLYFDSQHFFMQFVWQVGGDMVRQYKYCPECLSEVSAVKEAEFDLCPECGDDLSDLPPLWKISWASEAGIRTLDFMKKLRWQPWARTVESDGTEEEHFFSYDQYFETQATVPAGDAREFDLSDPETRRRVNVGCAYAAPMGTRIDDIFAMFGRGEIAMMMVAVQEEVLVRMEKQGVNFDLVTMAALPCPPDGVPYTHMSAGMWGINAQASEEAKWNAWEFIKYACGDANWKEKTRIFVENGMHYLVRPAKLKRYGYEEFYNQLDPGIIEVYDYMEQYARSMPWNAGWMPCWSKIMPEHLDPITYQPDGYSYDSADLLTRSQEHGNKTALKVKDERYYAKLRPYAYVLFFTVGVLFVSAMILISKSRLKEKKGSLVVDAVGTHRPGFILKRTAAAWLFMLPALLSVLLWRYIPLAQGAGMALFDFKLLEGFSSQFVGIDNFIDIFLHRDFYLILWNTLYYVVLVLGLGFVVPIVLALMLDEAPWGSIFFRVVFYLPAIMSPLVTLLLWQLLYEPTEFGLLNQLMMKAYLISPDAPVRFLEDPKLAMLCVIIPGIWAHAGPGCIIYLAALKVVPEDLYEAVAVDGGSLRHKLQLVTIPHLAPLIVINFIGAFIGAWQAMQNIFVLTGGGPMGATHVIGIEIWYNAFVYLRFGYSTAMAWILASMLVGFTVMQLRMFSRVEFKTAQAN